MQGRIHEVSILLNDDREARPMASALQAQIPALNVEPWQIVESTFYKSMLADKEAGRFSMTIVVFIVFIGVLNTVLMSVLERTREFGVLKAIGTRPMMIGWLITLETGLLATISIAVGFLFSLPVVALITFIGFELPEPLDVGGIAMSSMKGEMTAIVFWIPAITIFVFALLISIPTGLRAARILPTEAMGSH
jgi:ABC-type lipoprotein release transport system permease subunit